MSAVYATTSFSIYVTATGAIDQLQTGDRRDSADAVVVQAPQLFTSTAPDGTVVAGDELAYLQADPGGPDDPTNV